jgi:methionine aminotransferase
MTKIQSKLPQVGTTIFSIMSQTAQEYNAINLSQGFPDYEIDKKLLEKVNKYHNANYHQYAPGNGILPLRETISTIYEKEYRAKYDVDSEVLITNGASEAIFSSIAAIVHPNDEVIIFEPAYDLYAPTIQLFGGKVVPITTYAPDFNIDWQQVKESINHHTKVIILNTPNNPTGKMWKQADFSMLEEIIVKHPQIIIISDEVYGWITLNGQEFISVSQSDNLKRRSVICCSFGKLLHTTGWKIGYCIAPNYLMKEIKKVHQFNVFTVNHALQYAIYEYMEDEDVYKNLESFFQSKYDYLYKELSLLGFNVIPSEGTYFLLANYKKISNKSDIDFAKLLIEKYKVATIPVSSFYTNNHDSNIIRFCFAKKQNTLEQAINNLKNIN